ncbi:MAG: discoidin domain-containing protein [Candidatus Methylacidiphilales bacterium]|nr:discoidin domain-containing protein [Candidatus Methylacidiphilales bacterium]
MKTTPIPSIPSIPTLLLAILALSLGPTRLPAADKVPLVTELPKPLIIGTPVPMKVENLEAPRSGKRPDFLVPATAKNLALKKPVTSSDPQPLLGDPELVTDGDKDGAEGSYVELAKGTQWVQIDLGSPAEINALLVWHFHAQARVYYGVVVQVSNDPDFISGVTTVFNNDIKNVTGKGAGKDPTYVETYEGRLIDAKGVKGRYVRLYSQGNTANAMNHYIEVEVWGTPAN